MTTKHELRDALALAEFDRDYYKRKARDQAARAESQGKSAGRIHHELMEKDRQLQQARQELIVACKEKGQLREERDHHEGRAAVAEEQVRARDEQLEGDRKERDRLRRNLDNTDREVESLQAALHGIGDITTAALEE